MEKTTVRCWTSSDRLHLLVFFIQGQILPLTFCEFLISPWIGEVRQDKRRSYSEDLAFESPPCVRNAFGEIVRKSLLCKRRQSVGDDTSDLRQITKVATHCRSYTALSTRGCAGCFLPKLLPLERSVGHSGHPAELGNTRERHEETTDPVSGGAGAGHPAAHADLLPE